MSLDAIWPKVMWTAEVSTIALAPLLACRNELHMVRLLVSVLAARSVGILLWANWAVASGMLACLARAVGLNRWVVMFLRLARAMLLALLFGESGVPVIVGIMANPSSVVRVRRKIFRLMRMTLTLCPTLVLVFSALVGIALRRRMPVDRGGAA